MLYLDTFLQDLSEQELSKTVYGNSGSGNVPEEHQSRIVGLINSGLLRLYSRFNLQEKAVIIDLLPDRNYYPLHSKHAISQQGQPGAGDTFIRDSVECPFVEDVLRVLSVTSDAGCRLPINDEGRGNSVYLPKPDTVQIPHHVGYSSLAIIYQATHQKLSHTELDSVIGLPIQLVPALQAFVAWKVFSAIGTEEANLKALEHQNVYEALCREVEAMDLVSTSRSVTSHKFCLRGWI